MAISTYSELQTAIANWSNRSDLAAIAPDLIALAHERINRDLRVRQMEAALAETAITDNRIAVASNIVGIKTLWISGYEDSPLTTRPYEVLLTQGAEGTPSGWAWQGGYLYFDGSGSVAGVVYEAVPALSDTNTTNWLLTAHPSLYLSGAMAEACVYIRDQAGLALWNDRFKATLADIQGGDMRDRLSGPLTARAR